MWAQQGCGGATGKTTRWSFPLVTFQQDSGVNWIASDRLIVQPQAHFPLQGECCLSLASKGACFTLTSSQWQLDAVIFWWRIYLSMTDWIPGNMCVPLDMVGSGIGPTWFVVLLQLYPAWFYWGVSCLPRLLITVLRRCCFWGQIHSIPGYWSIPQYSWSNLFQFSSCRGSKIITVFSIPQCSWILLSTYVRTHFYFIALWWACQ